MLKKTQVSMLILRTVTANFLNFNKFLPLEFWSFNKAAYVLAVYRYLRLYKLYKSSAVAEMGDRGHNSHEPKRGGLLCSFRGGELGPRLTQCGLGRGLLPYQVASSSIQAFGHNTHGSKIGWGVPFFLLDNFDNAGRKVCCSFII